MFSRPYDPPRSAQSGGGARPDKAAPRLMGEAGLENAVLCNRAPRRAPGRVGRRSAERPQEAHGASRARRACRGRSAPPPRRSLFDWGRYVVQAPSQVDHAANLFEGAQIPTGGPKLRQMARAKPDLKAGGLRGSSEAAHRGDGSRISPRALQPPKGIKLKGAGEHPVDHKRGCGREPARPRLRCAVIKIPQPMKIRRQGGWKHKNRRSAQGGTGQGWARTPGLGTDRCPDFPHRPGCSTSAGSRTVAHNPVGASRSRIVPVSRKKTGSFFVDPAKIGLEGKAHQKKVAPLRQD